MSDDEEMEGFNVNDDDLQRAYNPGFGRKKMSKEQAMLGIWAGSDEGSSDDDRNDGFSFKNQSKKFGKKGASGRSSGISFINSNSSTNKRPEAPKEVIEDDDDQDENSQNADDKITDEEDEVRGNDGEIPIEETDSEEENENGMSAKNNFLLNQFQKSSKYGVKYAEPTTSGQQQAAESQPTSHKKGKKEVITKTDIKEIGNWEKYTKGIGAKLLQKMGWEKGKGIGKDLQGRAKPVEATLRKGKGSIGAHGPETKESRKRNNEGAQEDEDDEEEDDGDVYVSQWKKDKKGKKPQYSLRSADELLKIAAKNPKKLKKIENQLESNLRENRLETLQQTSSINATKIKVIDMTGKEQRVMHGYESLSQMTKLSRQMTSGEDKEKPKNFTLPELVHNIDILLSMTEDRILQADKKIKHYEDSLVGLSYEEKKTRERMNAEKEQIERINNLMGVIEKLEKMSHSQQSNLNELLEMFEKFQAEYADEFLIFNLSQVAIPLLTPLLRQKMLNWRPFEENDGEGEDEESIHEFDYCKKIYTALKSLLNETQFSFEQSNLNPYHRILWDTWMPSVRLQLSMVSLKQSSLECVDLLNEWMPLLPNWIVENILDQIVQPKLNDEVERWNPLTDTVPIHMWIHPWLPLMKDRLESTIFPSIRFKLGNALYSWHPSDESARAILRPWKPPVWSQANWDAFICKNIIPKLEYTLTNELILSPMDTQKTPDQWQWVIVWLDLSPLAHFIDLIERCFFTKWLYALSFMLNTNPDYEQISKWYIAWKARFSEKLLQHPNIKAKLSQGLLMMDRSMHGGQVAYTTSPIETNKKPMPNTEQLMNEARQLQIGANISTFKDIIERKAAEHNLVFLPVINKFKEGKQIYRFGNLNIYIDRNVIFLLQNGNWNPASMSEILQKAV